MRTLISATYDESAPNQNKIKAADGIMGIVILLAYWGGGANLFPKGVLPEFFVEKKQHGIVTIDAEGLTDLVGEMSKALGREIGQLSISSLPVYLTALRKGKRANNSGRIIPVNTTYNAGIQVLQVLPRDYHKDLEAGLLDLMPDGIPVEVRSA